MEINFSKLKLEEQKIVEKAVRLFLKKHPLNSDLLLEVGSVDAEEIKKMNSKFRKIDRPTDVLSFPIWKSKKEIPKSGVFSLGEIVFCPPEILRNAKNNGSTYDLELEKAIIHSLNHLIGLHHQE